MRRLVLLFLPSLLVLMGAGCSGVRAGEPDIRTTPPSVIPARPYSAEAEARHDALTRYGVGVWRDCAERLASAARQYQAAADRDPMAAAPQRELARVYADLGRDVAAIRAARKALELDPEDADTARRLGKLLHSARQYAEAGQALRTAADSPRWKNEPAQRLLALEEASRACQSAGNHEAAERACRDAIETIRGSREKLLQAEIYSPVELDRLRADLYERTGTALLAMGKFDGAMTAYELAYQIFADPKSGDSRGGEARLRMNLASVARAKGDAAMSLKYLESYLSLRPIALEPYQRYVEWLRADGRGDEVLAKLRQFGKVQPSPPMLAWLIASEQMRTDFVAADDLFRSLAIAGTDPAGYELLVRSYTSAGRGKALLDITEALLAESEPKKKKPAAKDETHPGGTAPPEALARVRYLIAAIKSQPTAGLIIVRQFTAELRTGKSRLENDPESGLVDLVVWLAIRDGQTWPLLEAVKLSIGRRASAAHYALAFDLFRHHRQWKELASLAQVARNTEEFRTNLTTYYHEAAAHAESGNAPASIKAIDFVIANVVADGKLRARLEKARLLNVLGMHKQALVECADIRKEFATPAADRRIRLAMAEAYTGTKDHARAEAEWRALLEEDPDDTLVLNNLGYNLADQGRQLPEAEKMVRRAVELDRFERTRINSPEPESGVYLDSLAWVLFRRGKLDEARKTLEAAVKLPDSGPDPVVWDHLGDVLFRLGENAAARRAWVHAIELYGDSHQGRQNGRLEEAKRKVKLAE